MSVEKTQSKRMKIGIVLASVLVGVALAAFSILLSKG